MGNAGQGDPVDRPSVPQGAVVERTVITTAFPGTPGPAGREGEASPTHGGVMTPGILDPIPSTSADGTCLGITCLKWAADGELSERDLQLVLQRMCRDDGQSWARRSQEDGGKAGG